jgi:hypothetical protein
MSTIPLASQAAERPAVITYDDASGDLRPGVIWEMATKDFSDLLDLKIIRCECTKDRSRELFECPLSRVHHTGLTCDSVSVDLFGGPKLGNFVPVTNHGHNIVSAKFADLLKRSGLTGWRVRQVVKIEANQSKVKEPELLLFEVVGKGGICHRYKVTPADAKCPFCGREPMICPGCGKIISRCWQCDKPTLVGEEEHPGSADKRVRIGKYPAALIVAAKDWDGSDLFSVEGSGGSWFATNKAKAWFEANHIEEIVFKPALLNEAK